MKDFFFKKSLSSENIASEKTNPFFLIFTRTSRSKLP